jgi:deoxyribodipyrimidine photo-lyase
MQSFHQERGELYRSAMSSPLEGESACSRLSPYLAFGAISLREVAQATQRQQAELKRLEGDKPKNWRASMASFTKRLHWRSHFMQKLESEPRLEFQNLHPAYDGLRTSATSDAALLEAWQKGETGLPFVDACMRYLTATGWLNFRMRAMLMSVASYHLWLHWREPGLHLARLFTDYEPGIHWPQTQMQSGTTGINTVRIYNPIKQGYDQDPKGEFVRRWVPELASLNEAEIHEPSKSQQVQCRSWITSNQRETPANGSTPPVKVKAFVMRRLRFCQNTAAAKAGSLGSGRRLAHQTMQSLRIASNWHWN